MKTAARHNILINTILLTHPVKINNIVAYLHKSKQQNDCQVQGSTILLHSLSYASYYMYFHLIYMVRLYYLGRFCSTFYVIHVENKIDLGTDDTPRWLLRMLYSCTYNAYVSHFYTDLPTKYVLLCIFAYSTCIYV